MVSIIRVRENCGCIISVLIVPKCTALPSLSVGCTCTLKFGYLVMCVQRMLG